MAESELSSLPSALMDVLEDLVDDDLDKFKFYILDPYLFRDFKVIRKSKLDTSKRAEILKAILDHYGIFTIDIVKKVLKTMNENKLLEELSTRCPYKPIEVLRKCIKELKSDIRAWFQFLSEGDAASGRNIEFNKGYTEPCITEGRLGPVSEEHEVSQMERDSRRFGQERTILCQDLFKGLTLRGKQIRTVQMKGVAGVGKTVLTQKFSLDWAEGRANQDIHLLFPFTFREINGIEDSYSLVELLHEFFDKTMDLFNFQQLKLLFILDGLDECRLPLNFRKTRILNDPSESASVEELLVNLIRGDLCPTARVWITTRPAAANQIPAECVSMVTEVRGFTDEQKDEFFRNRIKDKHQASAVIKHIKSIRSLYVMCYIPIFCWIVNDVLQHLGQTTLELPSTLTQIYIKFLEIQAQLQNKKYRGSSDNPWNPQTINIVLSLAKLAFEQLEKKKLIFSKSDLRECGLDAEDIARYAVFRVVLNTTESKRRKIKVYSFIHMSFQEFLAALHVHQTFFSSGENLLSSKLSPILEKNLLSPPHSFESSELTAPQSSTQLSNQLAKLEETPHFSKSEASSMQPGSQKDESEKTPQRETTKPEKLKLSNLKSKLKKLKHRYVLKHTASLSPKSAKTGPEESVSGADAEDDPSNPSDPGVDSSEHPDPKPTPEEFFYRSAVDLALQSPNGHLDLFLRFFLGVSLPTNQEALPGLLTQTRRDSTHQKTLSYIEQKLKEEGRSAEKSLNLLHCLNELKDHSLVERIQKYMRYGCLSRLSSPAHWSALSFLLLSSDGNEFDLRKYRASEYTLLKLMPVVEVSTTALLCESLLSHRVCAPLASAISSSSLKHLDLSNNDLQDSGVELLCAGLTSPCCRLETLRVSGCLVSERGGASLASALSSLSSPLRELDLSYNNPGPSADLLTALKNDADHPLQTLRLGPSGEQWMVPGLRKYSCEFSLDSNTAQRMLLLSENKHTVRRVREEQQCPDHVDRFLIPPQVLSSTGLRGRCYWEVQWSGRWGVDVAVSYRGDRRRGDTEERFGDNDQSWSLRIKYGGHSVCHNNRETQLLSSFSSRSGTVSVFLDSENGVLSFFEVLPSRRLLHLHTFTASFSQPLFPGFGLWIEDSALSVVDLRRKED